MFKKIQYILQRRKVLMQSLDVQKDFDEWEETCLPSYCHANLFAAYVSWQRLFVSAKLAKKLGKLDKVLDFGCGVAELKRLLPADTSYHYIEELDTSVKWIKNQYSDAVEVKLNDDNDSYDVIFALDSLEHNKNYVELVEKLINKLNPDGLLIVSGPTENILYRLGRKIAGFTGHYHMTTIHDINQAIDSRLKLQERKVEPFGLPLFVVSIWRK